ncbi:AAA family ATPase [Streptomyces sp. MMG1121]|uniref:nSTAND1 domain-containing NTPase n=1 Tax=Streptomyces sp. MMG1121 TaxID=1415544 RepID=UPI0006AEA4C4|nr:AAA family ATPase [Streptomyces sp. MMG1121]
MSVGDGPAPRRDPAGDGPDGQAFLYAEASDEARVFQAAGDQYIVEVRDLRATFVMDQGHIHRVGRPTADEDCPYPGLEPFGLEQADWYFGREELIADLTTRLDGSVADRTPLVVVAPSGAGKSSLLRAGLLPAIERGDLPAAGSRHWQRLVFTPTHSPMRALTAHFAMLSGPRGDAAEPLDWRAADRDVRRSALRRSLGRNAAAPDSRVVVIVDQLEEIFTQCEDEEERRAFVEELAWLADPGDGHEPVGLVVLGLRADFYGPCADHPWLRTAVERNQVFLGPMSRSELRDAIELPAHQVGLEVEPGLVEVLLRDLGVSGTETGGRDGSAEYPEDYEAGRLPLLAHALRATWMQRDDGRLTIRGYQATQGIEHAVADTAERAFAQLGPAEEATKSVFLRLVTVTEGSEHSRRRVLRADLLRSEADPQAARTVLDAFTGARLLTQDRDTVAITHEVLLRVWPRLKGWINDDRIGNVVRQELRDAAFSWERAGHDNDLLYRGGRLETAAASITNSGDVDQVTRAFLTASTGRAKRATRIRRGITAVLVTLFLLASTAAVFAFQQRGEALTERDTAIFSQITAEADRLRGTDSSLAAQLDLVAYRMHPKPDLYAHLITNASTTLSTPVSSGIGAVVSVAITADGRTMATGGNGNAVRLWNITDPTHPVALGQPLPVHADITESVAFSPDGRILAAGGNDATIRLWNVTDPARPVALGQPLTGHTNTVGAVAFSPDGRVLASGSADKTIRLWSMADPARPVLLGRPLVGHTDLVTSVAFRADGRVLASGSFDHSVRLWNVADPAHASALGRPLYGHGASLIATVAFSPDGHTLASGGGDNRVRLWNVVDPAHTVMLGQLLGHTGGITSVTFSQSGQTLASAGYDGSIKLWNVAFPDDPVARGGELVGHTGAVLALGFSHNGHTLVSGSADNTVRVWSFPPRLITSYSRSIASLAFSPDGHTLASGSADRKLRLWNVTDPARPSTLGRPLTVDAPATISSLAFSPDGHILAGGSADGTVKLWNTTDPARTTVLGRQLLTGMGRVMSVTFSPDGRTLAVAGLDGLIQLWNLTDPADPVPFGQPLSGHTGAVTSVRFSPDGHTLASGSSDKTIRLWNVTDPASPVPLGSPLTGHTGLVLAVAFSPDGRILAGAGYDSTIRLWNVTDPAHAERLGQPLTGHTSSVLSVAFSRDGRRLASGGGDSTVRLWDVTDPARAQALGQPLTGAYSAVESVAFNRDGRLVSAGDDGVIRLWDLNAEHAAQWICSTTRNVLTPRQWHKYIPQLPYAPPCP